MYGDPEAIHDLATRLRERAETLRDQGDRLLRSAEQAPWSGLAATAMRERAHDGVRGLVRCAEGHEDAADALDRHACEVAAFRQSLRESLPWAA